MTRGPKRKNVIPEGEYSMSLRLPEALLARIDQWCDKQPIRPGRSAAARYLIEQGMAALEKTER